MKKQFLSKSVPRGTRTIWRYLGALFILFTFAIGNVWAAYDVPADGTVTLSQKVNNGGRFNVEASGVYHFRTSSGYSWDSSNGIKTQSNEGGVVFYLDASKEIEVGIVHTEAKNAHEVTVHVYSITESVYKQFDDNKAGAAESNRTFSTAPTSSTDGSFTISITAESKTFTGKKTLAAGYYAVVPVGEKSKTFFKTIKFTTTGGGTDVCPSGISITGEDEYTEGEKIELTAALTAGNGDISYQWYKGSVAPANAISGATKAKYEVASCTTANAGDYFCVASKDDCSDAVNASAFSITVAADTKCFNMPAITSKPADLASVVVTGGTLSDVSTAKSVAMNANGLKLDGNSVYLKVTLADASIIAGTKITVAWKGAGSGAGIAVVNGDLAEKVIDETNVEAAGSATHTFTAAEAANYADEFIIHRNASGTGIYVNAITVEDCGPAVTKHTITLNYNDGATPDGTLKVVDGNAAVKPADPTRGKYTFLGWFVGDTDNEYVWSTTVTGDITLKAHWQDPWTLTFDADGGSEVADVTVKHNTKAEKPADPTKDDNDFLGWFYGDPAVAFDWDANVTQNYALVAHWQLAVAKYDVEYYDGETKIGTEEQVWATGHPTATGIDTDKPLYTFVGWYLTSALEGDPVNLNTVTPVEGLKIYGKWAKAYATSVDLKAAATGSDEYTDVLDAHNIAYELTNTSWDDGTDIYNGLKIKGVNSYIKFNLKKGQLLMMTVGYAKNDVKIEVNDVDQSFVSSTTELSNFIYYAESSDVVITVTKTANQGTASSIRSITIRAPYQVSFDANGGDDVVAPQFATPSVTLPSASKGTDSFVGWFDGETKVGEAGDTYTPTANIELVAHWEAVSTDARLASITFSATGTLSPAFDPEVTSYTYTMPYGTAAIPTITGATSVSNKAQDPIIGDAAAAWGDAQTVKGVAQSGDKKTYTITMVKAPKDGVVIIHADIPSGTSADYAATGLYAGTGNSKNEGNSLKLGTNHYAGVNLSGSEIFKEGDILNIHVKTKNGFVKAPISTTNAVDGSGVIFTEERSFVVGDNFITLTSAFEDAKSSSLYLVRTTAIDAECNPAVDYIEVTRAMNPILTAISFNGVAATKGTGEAYSVTLPEAGTNLASLTIVPTVIRNAAHATTPEAVVSNEGAWVAGDNTYRVMDKDGDYTDYTITITLQGEAPAPVITTQPADVAYCAGNEPTLTVEATGNELHYAWFKEAGETDEAVGSDQASYTVEAAGTYYVIVTNHVDGKLDKSITLANAVVTLNTPASITTQPTDLKKQTEGANITLSVVAANATGYQWYSCDNKDKENPSLIAGADEAEYEFAAAAGFFYCEVTGLCGNVESNVAQVTVKRSAGCQYITATSGYEATLADGLKLYACGSDGKTSTDGIFADATSDVTTVDADAVGEFNKQYIIMKFPVDVEEITLYGTNSSDRSINSVRVKSTIGSTSADKFTDDMIVATTKTATREGKDISMTAVMDEPISKDDYVFVNFNGGSMHVYRICYTEALPKPVLPTLSNQEYCAGGSFVAWNAETTVTEGTLSYQWYDADADEAIEGATNWAYTPTANGHYYVKVTNASAGRVSRVTQSSTLSAMIYDAMTITTAPEDVTTQAGVAASLSVEASGNSLSYAWYTCDANGDNAVALDPAVTTAELNVTAQLGVQYYKVVVTDDCDAELSAVAKVEGIATLPLVAINGSYTWDFTKASAAQIKLDGNTAVKKDEEAVMVNIPGVEVDQSKFKSQALKFSGEYIHRTDDGTKYPACATTIKFETTVPGKVTVVFADNGGNNRRLSINGNISEASTGKTDYKTYSAVVPAGEVVLTGYKDNAGGKYIRFFSIDFTAASELNPADADYTRDVTEGRYGTICLENGGVMVGATLYEVAYYGETSKKIFFDEILNGEMEAGVPYIYLPNENATQLGVFYTDAAGEDEQSANGLVGYIGESEATEHALPVPVGSYILNNNQYREVVYANSAYILSHRAYINLSAINPSEPALVPGRRRISMSVQSEQVVTGIDALNVGEQPIKVMINGQIFILRGEKMYDATGRLVK